MSHLSHVKQKYTQPIHLTHKLILCTQITRGRVHFLWGFHSEESLLAPSFEPVTIRPRSSLICNRTFLTGFGHFHGFTRPIQVASTLGDHFAAVASKLFGT